MPRGLLLRAFAPGPNGLKRARDTGPRVKIPTSDRREGRARSQRIQAASYSTEPSVSREIRLSRTRSTRHLGRAKRRAEYAWRSRHRAFAWRKDGKWHARSHNPRGLRPFSGG